MPCSNNIKGTLIFSWEIGKFTMDNSRLDLIKLDSLYIFEWRFVQSFEKVGYSETWNLWRNYFIMHILQSMFRKLTPHFYSSKSLHELANYCSMMIDIIVGGFNPSEKTWSNWILSQVGVNILKMKPPPRDCTAHWSSHTWSNSLESLACKISWTKPTKVDGRYPAMAQTLFKALQTISVYAVFERIDKYVSYIIYSGSKLLQDCVHQHNP